MIIGNYTNTIQPRVAKPSEEQLKRTRDKAEVFTPTWIVNQQNNLIDEAWFGRADVFNVSGGTKWSATTDPIVFPKGKSWMQYVDLKRLEISCGEAPYLVNRYDTVTGKPIPVQERVGLLDRKLRVINENIDNETEWWTWVIRAFQSTYGYEYQGDNVLLARENLLYTLWDYLEVKFGKEPTLVQQKKIANIVSWNIWQMDGISMTVPYSEIVPDENQMTIYDFIPELEKPELEAVSALPCRIFDWRSNESLEFRSMIKD